MSVALVTGSAGLVGAEAVRQFAAQGFTVIGIDNDMRRQFFGDEASTLWARQQLQETVPGYQHFDVDISDEEILRTVFRRYNHKIDVVIHTAAQPSHDWAASDPLTDFSINATGTMNLLTLTREFCPDAPFIFCSSNKVYGDGPNRLPLIELPTRWDMLSNGVDETMSIDHCTHGFYGASKTAADLLVQEFGRYFGLQTVCFRCGCLTGPGHSGAQPHGFLSYLMKCTLTSQPYQVIGYGGKQVRDQLHAFDLVQAFWHFFKQPRSGEVYNIGGGRHANCSLLEAIALCEAISGRELQWSHEPKQRVGDHIWWISNHSKFRTHYPDWRLTYDLPVMLQEMHDALKERHAA